MLNPKLKRGDRIRLLYMDGETLSPGTWGTVQTASNVFGDDNILWHGMMVIKIMLVNWCPDYR